MKDMTILEATQALIQVANQVKNGEHALFYAGAVQTMHLSDSEAFALLKQARKEIAPHVANGRKVTN
jgi:hypothetical protein